MTSNALDLSGGMPSSIDCEKTILGAILLDNAALYEAAATLKPDQFYLDAHRRIFRAMCELSDDGSAIDIMTLPAKLEPRGGTQAVGGIAYISSLIDGVPHQPTIEQYIEIVLNKWRLRQLLHLCQSTQSRALTRNESADEILAHHESGLIELAQANTADRTLREIGTDFLNEFAEKLSGKSQERQISTGVQALDEVFILEKGSLTQVAAWTSRGKSAFCRQVAYHTAKQGKHVLIFTPEVKDVRYFAGMVAFESGTPAWVIRDPLHWGIAGMKAAHIQEAAAVLMKELPAKVVDRATISITELVSIAKTSILRNQTQLIIVDYVQLIDSPEDRDDTKRLNRVSLGLQRLANGTGVPVISASQLLRPNDRSNLNARPTLFMLKQSGNLENDADNVLLLYRPVDEQQTQTLGKEQFTGLDEIIIGKQRNGEAGCSVAVKFNKNAVRYDAR